MPSLWLTTAQAADPPQTPYLRIEAGGHTGAIPDLATDATGHLLATAGYDKTIRLWSLPDGRQIEVLRPPIGPEQEGEIYAVALAPDGKRVFAAGATGGTWDTTFSIYIFDTAKGALAGLLPGLPAPIEALAISPDGTSFAAGLAAGGLRVWNASTGKPIFTDPAYTAPIRALVFDHHNRLTTAAADGKLRAYTPDGHLAATSTIIAHPWGLALSPDENLLAVTDSTAPAKHLRLAVLNATDLKPVFTPDTSTLSGEGLLTAAWSTGPHGSLQLLTAGYAHAGATYQIRRWTDFGLGTPTDIPAASDTIRRILPLPNGGAVYATEDPGWGLLAPDGTILRRPTPPMADLRPARTLLSLSPNGQTVTFATAAGKYRFDATARTLTGLTTPTPPQPTPNQTLQSWQDSNAPRLNNIRLPLDRAEFSRAAAFLPNGKTLLLGTDTHLRLFDPTGHQIAAAQTPAAAWAVAISADATTAAAALLDGTIRWYSLPTLTERAAFFADPTEIRWVVFTLEGFFDDGSRGGNELVGLLLNRARNQQPAWLSFSQAYRSLFAPAIVQAALHGDPTPARTRLAALGDLRTRITQQPHADIRQACLPAPNGTSTGTGAGTCPLATPTSPLQPAAKLRLTLTLTDRGQGVGPIDAFVNGRNVGRTPAPPLTAGTADLSLTLPLDPGPNLVQLRIYDATSTIFSETPLLHYGAGQATQASHRLVVLAIGIDHFAEPTLSLRYAVADATTFASLIRQAAAPIFTTVDITQLTDAQATKSGILAALDHLATTVQPTDTFIFYVASHGVRSEGTGRFMLVPQDIASIANWSTIDAAAIDETTLIAALARIGARDALLLLDTCYSGQITADNLANIGHETGRYLLAAAGSDQEALDSYDNKNGVFIYALREALQGHAAHDDAGTITALSFGEYISARVTELARQKGGSQNAVLRAAQRDLETFPIAKVIH